MNNGHPDGEYRRYDSEFKVSATIGQLHEAVHDKRDPIEALRVIAGIDDIVAALKCSPHEYEAHLKHLDAKTPYSPLTGHHVLNLCKEAGVHPVDLVSPYSEPQNACQPHIFTALLILSGTNAAYTYDRRAANVGLIVEERRYNNFVTQNPIFNELFDKILKEAREHSERPEVNIQNKDLRSILNKASNNKLNGHGPETHIENYHTVLSSRLDELDKTIFQRLIHDPKETANARFFGCFCIW